MRRESEAMTVGALRSLRSGLCLRLLTQAAGWRRRQQESGSQSLPEANVKELCRLWGAQAIIRGTGARNFEAKPNFNFWKTSRMAPKCAMRFWPLGRAAGCASLLSAVAGVRDHLGRRETEPGQNGTGGVRDCGSWVSTRTHAQTPPHQYPMAPRNP
jgi:hypothetical protein